MAFTGVTIDDLNAAARDLPMQRNIIQPNVIMNFPLMRLIWESGKLNKEKFDAQGNVQQWIETGRPSTGTIHYEDKDLILPADFTGVLMSIGLSELIVTAGLTHTALFRANGMPGSWVQAMKRTLELRGDDWSWLWERILAGSNKGFLARVVSATNANSITTIVCDNTYYDSGIENTLQIAEGDRIEIYASNNTSTRAGAAAVVEFEVLTSTPGYRNSGAATTGSFTVADDGTLSGVLADNDIVYISGVRSGAIAKSLTYPLPQGILAHLQDGTHFSQTGVLLATYQGLARSSYTSLRALIWDAADFASGTPGTPADWSLSVITNAFSNRKRGSGKGKPNLLLCDSDLALAIARRQKAESGITVNVSSGAAQQTDATKARGTRYAGIFVDPDGEEVPIMVADTLPCNCLFGIRVDDLVAHQLGEFMNWAPYLGLSSGAGSVWMKSAGDRKTNFEAPYGGYSQITGRRCDRHFVIMDMAADI